MIEILSYAMSAPLSCPVQRLIFMAICDDADADGKFYVLADKLQIFACCSQEDYEFAVTSLDESGFIACADLEQQFVVGDLLGVVTRQAAKHSETAKATVRKPIPASVRENVFRQDDYHCRYCGEFLEPGQRTIDHIIPVSRGGTDAVENLCCCCRSCNSAKRDRTPQEMGWANG